MMFDKMHTILLLPLSKYMKTVVGVIPLSSTVKIKQSIRKSNLRGNSCGLPAGNVRGSVVEGFAGSDKITGIDNLEASFVGPHAVQQVGERPQSAGEPVRQAVDEQKRHPVMA